MSSTSTRAIVIGRVALPWLIGLAALVVRGRFLELAPPSPCPGLLELIAIAAVRNDPDLTAGTLFGALQAIAIVVGLALFVKLVYRASRDMAVAAATGFAVGLSPLFASTLAPPWEAAAFGVCAAAALLAGPLLDRGARSAYALAGILGVLVIGAIMVPPWIVVAAIGAGALVAHASSPHSRSNRWLMGGAAATGIAGVALLVLSVSPPNALSGESPWRALAACVLPLPPTGRAMASASMAFASTIGWLLGPFALALSLLGAFVEARRAGWRRSLIVAALGLACLAPAAGTSVQLQVVLAPWVVGLWWLAASGLRDIVSTTSRGTVLRMVSVMLFLLLLPALQTVHFSAQERDDWVHPNGHENATLRQVTAGLNSVAPDAMFVEEDSTVDVLLRAAVFGGRRSGKRFTVGSRQPVAVAHALSRGPVYAFPKGREDLSVRGFATEPVTVTLRRSGDAGAKIEGIAAITGFRPCQTVGDTWADLEGGSTSGRIAIVADSEAAQGPVVIFLGGSTPVEPRPDAWPSRTTRGFRFALFDQRSGKGSDRLAAEARQLGLRGEHAVLAAPFVTRLTLHRTPRAPLSLAVVLGASFPAAVAKLRSDSIAAGHLTLCDAPAVDIAPFGSPAR